MAMISFETANTFSGRPDLFIIILCEVSNARVAQHKTLAAALTMACGQKSVCTNILIHEIMDRVIHESSSPPHFTQLVVVGVGWTDQRGVY